MNTPKLQAYNMGPHNQVTELESLALQKAQDIISHLDMESEEVRSTLDSLLVRSNCSPIMYWPLLLWHRFPTTRNREEIHYSKWRKCRSLYFELLDFDKYLEHLMEVCY